MGRRYCGDPLERFIRMSCTRPRRSFLFMSYALPILLADAGPRCGSSDRPRPQPTPAPDASGSDTSLFAPGASPEMIVVAGWSGVSR